MVREEYSARRRRHTLLVKYDKNDDIITEQKAGDAWPLLRRYDNNGDGKVSAEELSPELTFESAAEALAPLARLIAVQTALRQAAALVGPERTAAPPARRGGSRPATTR